MIVCACAVEMRQHQVPKDAVSAAPQSTAALQRVLHSASSALAAHCLSGIVDPLESKQYPTEVAQVVGDGVGDGVGAVVVGDGVGSVVVGDFEFGSDTHWESHCQKSI